MSWKRIIHGDYMFLGVMFPFYWKLRSNEFGNHMKLSHFLGLWGASKKKKNDQNRSCCFRKQSGLEWSSLWSLWRVCRGWPQHCCGIKPLHLFLADSHMTGTRWSCDCHVTSAALVLMSTCVPFCHGSTSLWTVWLELFSPFSTKPYSNILWDCKTETQSIAPKLLLHLQTSKLVLLFSFVFCSGTTDKFSISIRDQNSTHYA